MLELDGGLEIHNVAGGVCVCICINSGTGNGLSRVNGISSVVPVNLGEKENEIRCIHACTVRGMSIESCL